MPASLPAIVGAMVRFTIRLDEDLAADIRLAATEARRSVNGWVVAALQAAVDPQLAESSAERTRGRLGRAEPADEPAPRVDRAARSASACTRPPGSGEGNAAVRDRRGRSLSVYCDSSALVKRSADEPGAGDVRALTDVVVSEIARVEVVP